MLAKHKHDSNKEQYYEKITSIQYEHEISKKAVNLLI
jgi:hypothetical protein